MRQPRLLPFATITLMSLVMCLQGRELQLFKTKQSFSINLKEWYFRDTGGKYMNGPLWLQVYMAVIKTDYWDVSPLMGFSPSPATIVGIKIIDANINHNVLSTKRIEGRSDYCSVFWLIGGIRSYDLCDLYMEESVVLCKASIELDKLLELMKFSLKSQMDLMNYQWQ